MEGDAAYSLESTRRLVVSLVFLCLFLDNFSLYMLAPILDDVVQKINVDKSWGALLYCIKPLVGFPCSLVSGKLVAKFGASRTCAIGIVFYFICCWLHAFANSIWLWAAARVVQSIGSALTVGAGMYLIGLVTTESNRGKYMGLAFAGNGIGVCAGPLFGGLYYVKIGQSHVYGCLSSVAVLQMILCIWVSLRCKTFHTQGHHETPLDIVRDLTDNSPSHLETDKVDNPSKIPSAPNDTTFQLWKKILSDRRMLSVLLAATSACSVLGLVEPVLPGLIKRRFNVKDDEMALFWASGAAVYPVMVLISGWLSDRVRRDSLLKSGLIGFATLLPLWTILNKRKVTVFLYLAGLFGLDALVDCPVLPLIAGITEELGLGDAGSIAFTLGDVGQNFGYLIGPLLSSQIESRADHPLSVLLIMSAYFVTVACIVTVGFRRALSGTCHSAYHAKEELEGECTASENETVVKTKTALDRPTVCLSSPPLHPENQAFLDLRAIEEIHPLDV